MALGTWDDSSLLGMSPSSFTSLSPLCICSQPGLRARVTDHARPSPQGTGSGLSVGRPQACRSRECRGHLCPHQATCGPSAVQSQGGSQRGLWRGRDVGLAKATQACGACRWAGRAPLSARQLGPLGDPTQLHGALEYSRPY